MDSIGVNKYPYFQMLVFKWAHENSDIGVLNEDGYGSIVGRIKDMIIRGGENVYPREIEEVLYTHPGIQDAQVRTTQFFMHA